MVAQSRATTPRGRETCLVFPLPPAPTAPMVDPSLNLLAGHFSLPTVLHHQVPSPSPGHPNILFGHCTIEFSADSAQEPLRANSSSSLVTNLSITMETSCFSPRLVTTKTGCFPLYCSWDWRQISPIGRHLYHPSKLGCAGKCGGHLKK